MRTRVESHHQPEPLAPVADADGIESRLSGDHVDSLLTHEGVEVGGSDGGEPEPMNGIWLAVAGGVIFWVLIAGVVLLLV